MDPRAISIKTESTSEENLDQPTQNTGPLSYPTSQPIKIGKQQSAGSGSYYIMQRLGVPQRRHKSCSSSVDIPTPEDQCSEEEGDFTKIMFGSPTPSISINKGKSVSTSPEEPAPEWSREIVGTTPESKEEEMYVGSPEGKEREDQRKATFKKALEEIEARKKLDEIEELKKLEKKARKQTEKYFPNVTMLELIKDQSRGVSPTPHNTPSETPRHSPARVARRDGESEDECTLHVCRSPSPSNRFG